MKVVRKVVPLSAVLCAVLVLLTACESQEAIQKTSVTGKSVQYHVTAEELVSAYEENAIAADQKYKGKVIQVTGYINDFDEDIMGDPYITLCVDEYGWNCVQCSFPDSERKALARLSKGQRVCVKGVCKGKPVINVSLEGCALQ